MAQADTNASIAPNLTAFQRDLLYVIADVGPEKGLGIKAELEPYYETEINHGRLYPNLDTLVDLGLVLKGELDRRTDSYELSERGRQVLKSRRVGRRPIRWGCVSGWNSIHRSRSKGL